MPGFTVKSAGASLPAPGPVIRGKCFNVSNARSGFVMTVLVIIMFVLVVLVSKTVMLRVIYKRDFPQRVLLKKSWSSGVISNLEM